MKNFFRIDGNTKLIEIIINSITILLIIMVFIIIILLLKGFIKIKKNKGKNLKQYFKKTIIIDLILLAIPLLNIFILHNHEDIIKKGIKDKNIRVEYSDKENKETEEIPIQEVPREKEKTINNIEEKSSSSTEEKLAMLNNINNTVSFFLMDNLDRYISYKNINSDLTDEEIVIRVNIGIDNDFYTNIKSSPYQYTEKVLVNKYYSITSDYIPTNLVTVSSEYSSNVKLDKPAADAFVELCKDAKELGLTIYGQSGYRSYNNQKSIYNSYLNRDSKAVVDTYSARAGHSEHQTGLSIDISNDPSISYSYFGKSDSYLWLKDNAHKYGFTIRYTTENQFLTGYKSEPWHIRYFGTEISTYLYEHNITYEEYYVRFLQQ